MVLKSSNTAESLGNSAVDARPSKPNVAGIVAVGRATECHAGSSPAESTLKARTAMRLSNASDDLDSWLLGNCESGKPRTKRDARVKVKSSTKPPETRHRGGSLPQRDSRRDGNLHPIETGVSARQRWRLLTSVRLLAGVLNEGSRARSPGGSELRTMRLRMRSREAGEWRRSHASAGNAPRGFSNQR